MTVFPHTAFVSSCNIPFDAGNVQLKLRFKHPLQYVFNLQFNLTLLIYLYSIPIFILLFGTYSVTSTIPSASGMSGYSGSEAALIINHLFDKY